MSSKIFETSNKKNVLLPVAIAALFATFTVMPGCGNDDNSDNGDPQENFECATERDGWEQCLDNKVQYCHIVDGMDPHFHWGSDCETLGYQCVELTERTATCLDESSSCTVGEFKCEENSAYNCVDHDGHGHWAIDTCGTAKHCHEEAAEAHCEEESAEECGGHGHLHDSECHCEDGYGHDGANTTTCVINPEGICTLFSGTADQHTVVTTFAEFSSAHADLYEPIEVALPANASSYIHFPVTHDGEYVVFVDKADAIDAVMHRSDETDIASFHAAGANGKCSTAIPEHYHVALEMDGDEAPVPYIIRFSNKLTTSSTVRFMVVDK